MATSFDSETIQEDIAEKISVGKIVPVFGDNIFFIDDTNDTRIELHRYIVTELVKLLESYNAECSSTDSEFMEKACSGFKGMSMLNRMFRRAGKNLARVIQTLYRDHRIIERSYMDPAIKEFLELGHFPLIITTSYADIIEHHLPGEYSKVYYMKEKKPNQDIGDTDSTPYENLKNHTVFHILGSNGSGLDCAYTENDFLKYLHSLHDTNSHPAKLIEYMERRHILTLGCSIPDWTLRFLLYSFKNNNINDTVEISEDFNGGVVDTVHDTELEEFLGGIDYAYKKADTTIDIIKKINSILRGRQGERPKIFVSVYSSEDMASDFWRKQIMDNVITPLKERYEIWFCEEQLKGYAGEAYWRKIREGLQECDYFLPVLTPNMLTWMEKNSGSITSADPAPENEQGFITEWKYALNIWKEQHNNKPGYSIPFMLATSFPRVKEVFFPTGGDTGTAHLRKLIFGENEGNMADGCQIVDNVEKIKL